MEKYWSENNDLLESLSKVQQKQSKKKKIKKHTFALLCHQQQNVAKQNDCLVRIENRGLKAGSLFGGSEVFQVLAAYKFEPVSLSQARPGFFRLRKKSGVASKGVWWVGAPTVLSKRGHTNLQSWQYQQPICLFLFSFQLQGLQHLFGEPRLAPVHLNTQRSSANPQPFLAVSNLQTKSSLVTQEKGEESKQGKSGKRENINKKDQEVVENIKRGVEDVQGKIKKF